MATPDPELRPYEELIGSLEEKLGGLSAIHQGLGEAARSLVGAHRELDEATRSIDALTASNRGLLEEVRRLRPAELGATLDASLARLSRETAAGQGALGERLTTVGGEAAAAREQANAQFAVLAQQLAAHEETVSTRLSAIQHTVAEAHGATHTELAVLRDRQDGLRQALAGVHHRQDDLARRLDELPPLLTELRQHQTVLAQHLASVSEATVGIRTVADATQATAHAALQASERFGPTLSSALGQMRNDVVTEIARTRRLQLVSSLVILAAIAVAWAALAGLVPNP